jgi:integrase
VRRRLSALSSFYRYCAAHDLVDRILTAGVARPVVDPDYTATVGLARDQARALVASADADGGPQALRTAAEIRLLLRNALRVDDACVAGIADLGTDVGHRVLRVTRKGARKAKVPLTPATAAALDVYLTACGSWPAGWPAPRASKPSRSCRRTPYGTRRSPSLSMPGRPCATCLPTTPGTRTRGPHGATTTPGTA